MDYGRFDNVAANDDEGSSFGLQFVQSISDWGTDLYAGYRRYDLDRTGASFDAIDVILAGARVKF